MTEDRKFGLFLNLALFITKVIADIDIGNRIALQADDVMMMPVVGPLVPFDLIMEVDGLKDGSVGENIELSVE